jgi:hypothetical protein
MHTHSDLFTQMRGRGVRPSALPHLVHAGRPCGLGEGPWGRPVPVFALTNRTTPTSLCMGLRWPLAAWPPEVVCLPRSD